MIRFRLQELIADKSFKENRRITIGEVAPEPGINRMTLSKMINHKGYSTVTDNLDKLCAYFDCELVELAEYIPVSKDE
jgi:putative transcriptional regulator